MLLSCREAAMSLIQRNSTKGSSFDGVNPRRPHSALGWKSQVAFEQKMA